VTLHCEANGTSTGKFPEINSYHYNGTENISHGGDCCHCYHEALSDSGSTFWDKEPPQHNVGSNPFLPFELLDGKYSTCI
jgi:hypothetical protein